MHPRYMQQNRYNKFYAHTQYVLCALKILVYNGTSKLKIENYSL